MNLNNSNMNNIKSNMDCMNNNKTIKIKNVKKMNPTRCSIMKVGNKFTELCQTKKKCETINNILQCPAYELDEFFGTLDNIGENPVNNEKNINSNSNKPKQKYPKENSNGNINSNDNINSDKNLNNIIKNSISCRINNMNYEDARNNIKQRKSRFYNEPFHSDTQNDQIEINLVKNQEESESTLAMSEHLRDYEPNLEIPSNNISDIKPIIPIQKINPVKKLWYKHNFWIILCIFLFIFLFIGILIGIHNLNKKINKPNFEVIETLTSSPSTISLPSTPSILKT